MTNFNDLKTTYRKETILPPGDPLNIVLVGKTGNGKSSTANTIFYKKQLFKASGGLKSETLKCQMEHGYVGGRKMLMVDTPGTIDIKKAKETLREISSAIYSCPKGYDAILVVMKHGNRTTSEEKEALVQLKKLFGKDVLTRYGIFVFTHGENYEEDPFFSAYMMDSDPEFMEHCNYRCILFKNKIKWDKSTSEMKSSSQVLELVKQIDELVKQNRGERYINTFFQLAKSLQDSLCEFEIEECEEYWKANESFEKKKVIRKIKEQKISKYFRKKELMELAEMRKLKTDTLASNITLLENHSRKVEADDINDIASQMFDTAKREQQKEIESKIMKLERESLLDVAKITENQNQQWEHRLKTEQRIIIEYIKQSKEFRSGPHDSFKEKLNQFKEVLKEIVHNQTSLHTSDWKYRDELWIYKKELLTIKNEVMEAISQKEIVWSIELEQKCRFMSTKCDQKFREITDQAFSDFKSSTENIHTTDTRWRKTLETTKTETEAKWKRQILGEFSEIKTEWKKKMRSMKDELKSECSNIVDSVWTTRNEMVKLDRYKRRHQEEKCRLFDIKKNFEESKDTFRKDLREQEQVRLENYIINNFQVHIPRVSWHNLHATYERIMREWDTRWTGTSRQILFGFNQFTSSSFFQVDYIKHKNALISCEWKQTCQTAVEQIHSEYLQKIGDVKKQKLIQWNTLQEETVKLHSLDWQTKLSTEKQCFDQKLKQQLERFKKGKTCMQILTRKSLEARLSRQLSDFKEMMISENEFFRQTTEKQWKQAISQIQPTLNEDAVTYDAKQSFEETIKGNRLKQEYLWEKEFREIDIMKKLLKEKHSGKVKQRKNELLETENIYCSGEWKMEASKILEKAKSDWNDIANMQQNVMERKKVNIIRKLQEEAKENCFQLAKKEAEDNVDKWSNTLLEQHKMYEQECINHLNDYQRYSEKRWTSRFRRRTDDENLTEQQEMQEMEAQVLKKVTAKRESLEKEWQENNEKELNIALMQAVKNFETLLEREIHAKNKAIHDSRQLKEDKWLLSVKRERIIKLNSLLKGIGIKEFEGIFVEENKCFPADAKVMTNVRGSVVLGHLLGSDNVLTSFNSGMPKFSEIIYFGHRENNGTHIFVRISTKTKTIMVSRYHHIHIGIQVDFKRTKKAISIDPGDVVLVLNENQDGLVPEVVTEVYITLAQGLCAPYTHDGTIIVDDVLASCYVDRVKPWLAHRLLAPVRLVHRTGMIKWRKDPSAGDKDAELNWLSHQNGKGDAGH